jgi:hypothetical protein
MHEQITYEVQKTHVAHFVRMLTVKDEDELRVKDWSNVNVVGQIVAVPRGQNPMLQKIPKTVPSRDANEQSKEGNPKLGAKRRDCGFAKVCLKTQHANHTISRLEEKHRNAKFARDGR